MSRELEGERLMQIGREVFEGLGEPTMREEADFLYALGWNVLPVTQGSKAPCVPWAQFQTGRIPRETFDGWTWDGRGMGVLCGQVSDGLAVLDFDDADAFGRWVKVLPDVAASLPTATTGRGFHVFFRSDAPLAGGRFRLAGETAHIGELLTDRKHCVLPPTRHPSGALRTWVRKPTGRLPVMTLAALGVEPYEPPPDAQGAALLPRNAPPGATPTVPEGQRHNFLLSVSGRLRNADLTEPEILAALEQVNSRRCVPPLPVTEVLAIARWAGQGDVHSPYKRSDDDDEALALVHHGHGALGSEDEADPLEDMFLPLSRYLAETPAGVEEWLVEDFLPVSYLAILGGTSKAGKSSFLTAMAMHIADGREFMGLATTQGAVLWCALEETEAERRIGLEAYDGEAEDLYTSHHKIRIDHPDGIEALRHWVRKTGAKLIVVDPLYGAHGAESLGDGSTARRVIQPLKDLCREERVSAVIIHHLTKNTAQGMARERFADSNQLLAAVSMDMLMDSQEIPKGGREITLKCRGRGEFANQTWVIDSPGMGEYILARHGKDADRGTEAIDAAILDVIAEGGHPTAILIADKSGLNLGTVRNRLTSLKKSGQVVEAGKHDRSNVYELAA